MAGRSTGDENNFNFVLDGRVYVMEGGALTVDGCVYENEPDKDTETYALARAYWRLSSGRER